MTVFAESPERDSAPWRADVERFVQAGGGLLGLEAAPQVQQEWSWYHDRMSLAASRITIPSEQLANQIDDAIGGHPLNYQIAKTQRVPEENRFVKEVLDFNLNEPMELDEVPGRGILFVERRGAIKLYDFESAPPNSVIFIRKKAAWSTMISPCGRAPKRALCFWYSKTRRTKISMCSMPIGSC